MESVAKLDQRRRRLSSVVIVSTIENDLAPSEMWQCGASRTGVGPCYPTANPWPLVGPVAAQLCPYSALDKSKSPRRGPVAAHEVPSLRRVAAGAVTACSCRGCRSRLGTLGGAIKILSSVQMHIWLHVCAPWVFFMHFRRDVFRTSRGGRLRSSARHDLERERLEAAIGATQDEHAKEVLAKTVRAARAGSGRLAAWAGRFAGSTGAI